MPTHAVLASSSKKKKPYFLFPSRWFTYFKLSPPPKPPLVAERLHQKALEPAPAAVVSPGTRGAPDTSSRAERRARTPGPASEGSAESARPLTRRPAPRVACAAVTRPRAAAAAAAARGSGRGRAVPAGPPAPLGRAAAARQEAGAGG
nr:uncharacterized protein LOC111769311 isoform X1 [Equus caballus]